MRRSRSPQPSSPTPIATARPVSSPVRGSVEEEVDGAAELVDDELVVGVLEEELAVAELLDDEVTVVELLELDEGVELGADGCVLVVLEWWLPEPEEPEPPSGSVYCWSPAEPPPAMAVAGASIARTAITKTKPRI